MGRTAAFGGALTLAVFAFALGDFRPASAGLDGPCTASGTLVETGKVYDPKQIDEATIPRAGEIAWQGATGVTDERVTTGHVRVAFPPPIGEVVVGEWDDESTKPGNNGTYTYDLPSVVAGVDIPVSGQHAEPGIECSGKVVVTIDGTSPLAWASLALTVISLIGVFLSMQVVSKAGG
jgi:hypothetical protein